MQLIFLYQKLRLFTRVGVLILGCVWSRPSSQSGIPTRPGGVCLGVTLYPPVGPSWLHSVLLSVRIIFRAWTRPVSHTSCPVIHAAVDSNQRIFYRSTSLTHRSLSLSQHNDPLGRVLRSHRKFISEHAHSVYMLQDQCAAGGNCKFTGRPGNHKSPMRWRLKRLKIV